MERNVALSILRRVRPQLETRGVAHAALFGSIARGEATTKSDIDIMLTPAPGVRLGLFDLGALQTLLEEAFGGISVDIVIAPVKKPALRQSIERDAARVF